MSFPPLIDEFMQNERWKYDDVDQYYFAFSVGQIGRYYGFLSIIRSRVEQAELEYRRLNELLGLAAGEVRQPGFEGAMALERSMSLGKQIQLDVESYYVFGKIALNKAAKFIEDYFREGRGCSLLSHDKLIKHFEKFATQKELVVPADLLALARKLRDILVDYRDKQIEHHWEPRSTAGLYYRRDEGIRLSGSEGLSTPLSAIQTDLDAYLHSVWKLIQENRAKGRFKLRGTSNGRREG